MREHFERGATDALMSRIVSNPKRFSQKYGPKVSIKSPSEQYTEIRDPETSERWNAMDGEDAVAKYRPYQGRLFYGGEPQRTLSAWDEAAWNRRLLDLPVKHFSAMSDLEYSRADDLSHMAHKVPEPSHETSFTSQGTHVVLSYHPQGMHGPSVLAWHHRDGYAPTLVGELRVNRSTRDPDWIGVHRDYRDMGIARSMFRFAQALGPSANPAENLHHSDLQTDLGQAYSPHVPDDPEQEPAAPPVVNPRQMRMF